MGSLILSLSTSVFLFLAVDFSIVCTLSHLTAIVKLSSFTMLSPTCRECWRLQLIASVVSLKIAQLNRYGLSTSEHHLKVIRMTELFCRVGKHSPITVKVDVDTKLKTRERTLKNYIHYLQQYNIMQQMCYYSQFADVYVHVKSTQQSSFVSVGIFL